MHNTQHWTGEIGNSFLVLDVQSPGEEERAHPTEPLGGCTQEQSEGAGLVSGRL